MVAKEKRMIRTQVQLSEFQMTQLKDFARRRGVPSLCLSGKVPT